MASRIAIACGGTGGHIMPGLATASALQARGHEVTLWMTGKETEKHSVADWPGAVVRVPAQGFPTSLSVKGLQTAWRLWQAASTCTALMREHRPDALLAMGSYASVGPVMAARRLGVPYLLHEANVIPGRAIRWLARGAAAVAGSFEETYYHLKITSLTQTGMPLRQGLEDCAAAHVHAPSSRLRVLVMGGSAGAHALNEVATEALCNLHRQRNELQVVHLTGNQDRESVHEHYADAGVSAEVRAFSSQMATIYTETDLAICRAGASTCAELALFGVPALLVPYPHAANDHQTANARALEKAGAADVVAEKDLTAPWLQEYLSAAVTDRRRLDRMRAALRGRVTANAADRLATLVERIAMGTGNAP